MREHLVSFRWSSGMQSRAGRGGREDERAQEECGKDDMRSKGKMVFL